MPQVGAQLFDWVFLHLLSLSALTVVGPEGSTGCRLQRRDTSGKRQEEASHLDILAARFGEVRSLCRGKK